MPHARTPFTHRQSGASMIELLVSVLIFAFGMLGLVGMMTKTLGYGQISLYRSQATALSDDVLDRMRTDPANAKTGAWSNEIGNSAASFTGTTLAQTELKDWKTQIEALLPSGKAAVTVNTGVVTVTITWDERGTTPSFRTVSSL